MRKGKDDIFMDNCIFCKIIKGEINTEIVYEDDFVICFKDISPSAPVHVLIVPKKHYDNILEMNSDKTEGKDISAGVFDAVSKVAMICNVSEKGFRLINNCKEDGGQTINHVHFHLLGGKKLNVKLI